MKKLLLKNARVVSSEGIDEKDIVISGENILKVCEVGEGEDMLANIVDEKTERTFPDGEQNFPDENTKDYKSGDVEIIDCGKEGVYVLPGLIDTHVHFREPGFTEKADFNSESTAALRGGVTTIFDMPNTDPATTTKEVFAEKVKIAQEKCKCNFKLYMSACETADATEVGKVLDDKSLSRYLAGVKVFMGCSTGCLLCRHEALESVLADEKLRFIDDLLRDGGKRRFLPIVVHAEDEKCLVMNAAKVDGLVPENHSKARPIECAVIAIRDVCHLARKYNRPIHIAHVTSFDEIEVIEKFKDDYVEVFGGCVGGECDLDSNGGGSYKVPLVTFEVSPHHLFLNDGMYKDLGWFLKVNPPVRSISDVGRLWQALYDGEVDMIASDHSPHTEENKGGFNALSGGEVGDVSAGMPEVETTLPLLLNEVSNGKMALKDIVRLCSSKPAEIFGLTHVGRVESGMRADLVVVDMGVSKVVKAKDLAYKCGWTCYEGRKLKGWPVKTIFGGEAV